MTPYVVQDGRLCRQKQTSDGIVSVPLCNFTARVVEEIVHDDGTGDTTRGYVIEGQLATGERLPRTKVPANRFGSMAWVADAWGSRAVVRAGHTTRDYLREAIQSVSRHVPQRRVYTHTGWREIAGQPAYLTAAGAVGRDDVDVSLGSGLDRYRLPREAKNPTVAMQASLRLLSIAPLRITVPLWACVYRAPLASLQPIDVSASLTGTTGSLKTTKAALFLAHYGAFDRLHLPGSWSSTANHLEAQAFALKDALYVIDDFAPRIGLDSRELEAKAARVYRAQGNLSGRGRLRADATERPTMPPRGMILSTGEQHATGHSIVARTFLIQTAREDVDLKALTEAQSAARMLPHAMAGYVMWLAEQMPSLEETIAETFANFRAGAVQYATHLRVPEAVAHLYLGVYYGLEYAKAIEACSEYDADRLGSEMWTALLEGASAQSRAVIEAQPVDRFLRTLATLIVQGRVCLLRKDEAYERTPSHADFIGWYDDDRVYLIPDAASKAVSKFAREADDPFPISRGRLGRELAEQGVTECKAGRDTKVVRIGERTARCLVLVRATTTRVLGEAMPVTAVAGVTGYGE